MDCQVTEEQLWSWIDRNAPELEAHLAVCPRCRAQAAEIRAGIRAAVLGSAPAPPPLPERIGTYRVRKLIGEGGQALVYEAEQQDPRRLVAVKVLRGGCCVTAQDIRHFRREAQALATLRHAGIATIYEAGRTAEGQHFFAMELVDGEPLHQYVRSRQLELEDRLRLFCRICEAVHYAHEQGVTHRDLKPTNVLVDKSGQPKVLDFGLARVSNADVSMTCLLYTSPSPRDS